MPSRASASLVAAFCKVQRCTHSLLQLLNLLGERSFLLLIYAEVGREAMHARGVQRLRGPAFTFDIALALSLPALYCNWCVLIARHNSSPPLYSS